MDRHVIAQTGDLLAIFAYMPLAVQILKGTAKQNFATWILWASLDGIVAASLMFQHGAFVLPLIFTIGSTSISLCILRSGERKWTWFETMIALLSGACMAIWALSNARTATIASTAAVCIATVPMFVEGWEVPEDIPLRTYTIFFFANLLGTIGAKDWTVPERFYPTTCMILCAILLALGARKYTRFAIAPIS